MSAVEQQPSPVGQEWRHIASRRLYRVERLHQAAEGTMVGLRSVTLPREQRSIKLLWQRPEDLARNYTLEQT